MALLTIRNLTVRDAVPDGDQFAPIERRLMKLVGD